MQHLSASLPIGMTVSAATIDTKVLQVVHTSNQLVLQVLRVVCNPWLLLPTLTPHSLWPSDLPASTVGVKMLPAFTLDIWPVILTSQ